MSYQGVIRQGDKVPADGNYMMTFSLYTSVTGSQAIWTETQQVSVNGGLFNVFLGSLIPLPSALPTNVWVGVRFGNDEEFSRTKLTSVPFALSAGTAQALAPNAKGAVLSLNGHQGAVELKGSDGLKVSSDNGILTIGMTNERKSEDVLNQGTEWLLAGNSNATSTSWLGTTNNFPLIIKTNNTERMRVLSTGNGNVGIGDNNPGSRLTVAKTFHLTNAGGAPELKLSAASGANSTTFKTTSQSSNITYTLPPNDGNDGDVLTTDGTGELSWVDNGWGTAGNSNISSTKFLGTTNSQPLIVKTNNAERFRVTSGGAMGINEDNPSQKLEVAGNILIKPEGSNTGELRIQEANGGSGNNYTAFKSGMMGTNITYTLPTVAPAADQVLTSSALGVLSWTTVGGASGVAGGDLTGTYPNPDIAPGVIVNADISNSAAIAYSKLNLAGAIVNSDISGTAAIAYSKLDLVGNIVDADISGTAAIAYSKLDLTGSIVNSDVSATAAIAYSKLDLAGNIVDADVSGTAAIAYSKLDLAGNIVDADISGTAAIAYSKLDLTGNITNSDVSATAAIAYSKLDLVGGIVNADVNASAAIAYSKLNLTGGIVNSDVSNSAAIAYSKLDLAGSIVDADISGTAAIAYSKLDLAGNIVNADISGTAAIAYSKLDLTGNITNSDVSATAAIAYSKLDLANSIVAGDITSNAITTTKIADNAVDGAKISLGADWTGDIMYYNGTDYVRLPIGSASDVLTVSGGVPAWSAPSITVNSTLTGNGSPGTPLGINLGNSNTWTGNQTFAGTFLITSNCIIALTNSNNNAKDIRWQEPSGTGSQYVGFRAPSVTNNGNYRLPSVVGSVGQALTIQYSNGVDSAYTEWSTVTAQGSAGGDLSGTYPNPQIAAGVIVNADINSAAAIAYSKLDLAGGIVNSDVSNSAAIAYSKLDLTGGIVNSDVSNSAAIAYSKLDLSSSIVNADISGTAAIAYSKLDLAGTIVNADISGTAAIAYSKLDLTGSIVNADVSATAAIAYSKLDLANSIVAGDITSNAVTTAKINNNAVNGTKIAMGSDATGDIMYYNGTDYVRLPIGADTEVLTVSSGVPTWAAGGGGGGGAPSGPAGGDLSGTYPNPDIAAGVIVNADINASAGIAYSKLNLTNSIVSGDIAAGTIDNSDISGTAAIAYSKLNLTNSIVAGDITSSAVTTSKIANNAVDGTKIAMGSDATGDIMYYNGTDYARRAIGSNGDVLTVSGGVPTWAAPSGGGGASLELVATGSSQSISANATIDLTLNTTVTSPSVGSFNGTTYTVGAAGLYLVTVSYGGSTTTLTHSAILVNGTVVTYGAGAGPTIGFRGNVSMVLNLSSSDQVKIQLTNVNGATTANLNNDGTTRFVVTKLN